MVCTSHAGAGHLHTPPYGWPTTTTAAFPRGYQRAVAAPHATGQTLSACARLRVLPGLYLPVLIVCLHALCLPRYHLHTSATCHFASLPLRALRGGVFAFHNLAETERSVPEGRCWLSSVDNAVPIPTTLPRALSLPPPPTLAYYALLWNY